jgi:large subunit ribosomal protein L15
MLSNLKKRQSHKTKKTRIGRGYGSGHGGHTSTRGQKGMKSRTGGKVPAHFEGGQLPLVKRLPHVRGKRNVFKKTSVIIKTSFLNNFEEKDITVSDLTKKGFIKRIPKGGVKVLKDAEVSKPLNLVGFIYSASSRETIEKAGGTAG